MLAIALKHVQKLGHVLGGDHPNLGWVHSLVVMGEQSPQPHNVRPRDFGVGSPARFGHGAGGFADDLEQALDGKLSDPVRAKRLLTIGDNLFNDVGRVDNVSDALTISLIHL
jgi:hypothetical protein